MAKGESAARSHKGTKFRLLFGVSLALFLIGSYIMNVLPPGFDRGIGGILMGALTACISIGFGVLALIALTGWFLTDKERRTR